MLRRFPLVVATIVLASCGTNGGSSTTDQTVDQSTTTTEVPRIEWSACTDDPKLDCARLAVPFDYSGATQGSFSLRIVRRPADNQTTKVGSMLVNPGGPGFGGSFLAESAESYFSENLLSKFDIIGWDPRGTGKSTPAVDCIDDYDEYFAVDPTPSDQQQKDELVRVSKEFADACETRSAAILPHISTNNTARDMDTIRRALREDTITYFGFSYGSELGATWATMFPTTVRAAVLDGAVDPAADYMEAGLQQARGFESELTKFLARCSRTATCAFHNSGKSEVAFDRLMAKLDAQPLVVSSDRTPVNLAVAMVAVSQAMYSSSIWGDLEAALADAQKGDGAGLLALNDSYFERNSDGTYGNELEAFLAISCLDDPGPSTVAGVDEYLPTFKEAAPRLWPGFTGGYACQFWPATTDPRVAVTGTGAGPIVVIGTTGDAATPLAGTRKMASTLEDGRLIIVAANRHTGYGVNACVVEAVDDYLISTNIEFSEKSC